MSSVLPNTLLLCGSGYFRIPLLEVLAGNSMSHTAFDKINKFCIKHIQQVFNYLYVLEFYLLKDIV